MKTIRKYGHASVCHIAVVLLLQSYAAFNSVFSWLLYGIKHNPYVEEKPVLKKGCYTEIF